jgi:hypothetical protein
MIHIVASFDHVEPTGLSSVTIHTSADFKIPIPVGDFVYPYNPGVASYLTDRWATYKESTGALGPPTMFSSVSLSNGDDPSATPSPATTNYTAGELTGLMVQTFSTDADGSLTIEIQDGYRASDGLHYPLISIQGSATGHPPTSGLASLPFSTTPNTSTGVTQITKNLDLTIDGTVVHIPLYLTTFDPENSDYVLINVVFSATMTPYKYWPYKDGAGVAKYDEDTGALL